MTRTPVHVEATHVDKLELDIYDSDLQPQYAKECIDGGLRDENKCRCIIYTKRVDDINTLSFRCFNGPVKDITTIP